MTRLGWLIVAGLVLCILTGVAAVIWFAGSTTPTQQSVLIEEPLRTIDPSAVAIYTNGTYGFSFFYPATAVLVDEFTSASVPDWREHAVSEGMLVVEVATTEGEARIGVSTDAEEVAACLTPAPAERVGGITQVASTSWNVFTSTLTGTDVERAVRSYRTISDNQCIALELYLAQGVALEDSSGPALILESFTLVD